jgi:acetyltransferase-like isoleucine patch superfamily enzyme
MNIALRLLRKVLRLPLDLARRLEQRRKMEGCAAGEGVCLYPGSRIENHQARRVAIAIGANSHVVGQLRVFGHGGKINLGEECFVGEDSRIWSASSIRIGRRVQIAHGVNIHDNNSHSLSANSRYIHFKQILSSGHPAVLDDVPSAPIVIEDDVWIGFNATILKGVTIGKGAVVGAASVVTKDVPAYTVVAGSPAKMIGTSRP